jgi:hypothetical protein
MFLCVAAGSAIAQLTKTPLITGVSLGLLTGVAPLLGLGVLYALIMWWHPDLPPCRCGKTKYGEYEYIGPMSGPFSEDTWYENRCPKCGRHYKSNRGVVVEQRSDGSVVPYMKESRWGRWIADSDASTT